MRVTYADTGQVEEYVDIDAELPEDFVEHNAENIKKMDCVSCHNRVSHHFPHTRPGAGRLYGPRRNRTLPIPYFKQNAVAVIERRLPQHG